MGHLNYVILFMIVIIFTFIIQPDIPEKFEHSIVQTIDVQNRDIVGKLQNKLSIMSSNKRAVVVIDKEIIYDDNVDGLLCIVLDRSNSIVLKYKQEFHTGCCRNQILNCMAFLDEINKNDIIIIVSSGDAFKLLSYSTDNTTKLFKERIKGISKTNVFREKDNYILVTSKLGDVYYELISPEPVYYPWVNITKKTCKINPGNIKYPEKYIIFNDKTTMPDTLMKCAIESNMRGYGKFGIQGNYCIPMSDNDYYDKFNFMKDVDNCFYGLGGDNSISGYEIMKHYTNENIVDSRGVVFYELPNFEGRNFVLDEGIYESEEFNRKGIQSINIPYSYFVFLVKGNEIIPFYGPIKINLTNFQIKNINEIDTIIIQKHNDTNAMVCAFYKNKQICMTFGPGIHTIYPKLFFKILQVNMNKANNVELYGNFNSTDLIDNYDRVRDGQFIKVKYPRIVRSIKVS